MSKRGEKLVKALDIDPRTMLRLSIKRLELYSTNDARRLVSKLRYPDIKQLMTKAEDLITTEGTLISYSEVDTALVRRDLDALLDIQVMRQDIASWARDFRSTLESKYTFSRLDWLWDFSWSYLVWGHNTFKDRYLLIYGAILGRKPQLMGSVPLQAALNYTRKRLVREHEREIYRAAKSGDIDTLRTFGLTKDQAQNAVSKVARASL